MAELLASARAQPQQPLVEDHVELVRRRAAPHP